MEQLHFISVERPVSKCFLLLESLLRPSTYLNNFIRNVYPSLRSQSHKWTVYVRGATNEDLGAVIKRVVFQLHPSFNNPTRVVESPPFELSECGWGEFEIAISLFFHSDVCDKQVDL